jgi:hypothetical protein
MALAGYITQVWAKSTNATPVTGDLVNGISSIGFDPKTNILDATDFKDSAGWALKLAGLKDFACSLGGDLEPADAPQNLLRSSYDSGSTVWVTFHCNPSGTAGQKGFQLPCLVESYSVKSDSGGKAEFSASLTGNGTPVAV